MRMTAEKFVEEVLPASVAWDIITHANDPVMESLEDLAAEIDRDPEQFADIIREYAPDWAEEILE